METVLNKFEQKNLGAIANSQVRVPVRMELQNLCKKVLSTTATCFVTGMEHKDAEIRVNGKVVTRIIFVDEFDGYNSEENTTEFSEKFTPKNAPAGCNPMAGIVATASPKTHKNEADLINAVTCEHTVNVALTGLVGKEVSYVHELKGDVEMQTAPASIATYGNNFMEKFEIGETFSLDQNIDGILGTELNAYVREIVVANEKFTIKGVAAVSVAAVKSADGSQSVCGNLYEFDFAKTFNKKEIHESDIICGSVTVSNLGMKVENRTSPELVIEAELCFNGHSIVRRDINMVTDAFSCDHVLEFAHGTATDTIAVAQTNIIADVEGNVSMPENSPFIGKVLFASSPIVGSVNVKPQEDKVIVEGVLTSHIIYECEEKHVYSHTAEVPFSLTAKIENCTPTHNVSVALAPMSCNVKARRGKELLVDARMGVNLCATANGEVKLTANVTKGAEKAKGNHAITIKIAGAKDTLWDCAKQSSIPTAEILRQNPHAANGITDGDRLVMYKKAR